MPALMTPPAARQLAARSVAGELAARLGLEPAELAEVELATDGRGVTFATDAPDRPFSADPIVGALVDAYNAIKYGYLPRVGRIVEP